MSRSRGKDAAKDLLVEVGTEEIPSSYIGEALRHLDRSVRSELETLRLGARSIDVFGTPRRLAFVVRGLPSRQREHQIEVTGPPAKAAFDAEGRPTRAALGFARAQGIVPKALRVVKRPKGDVVAATRIEKGRAAPALLAEAIPRWILGIPFPKSMRWGDGEIRFVRPIHWVVALFGDKVVPFRIGDLRSGDRSRGHRFLSPGSFRLRSAGRYVEELKKHRVLVSPRERQAKIRREVEAIVRRLGGRSVWPEGLLEAVTFLTEWPAALCGAFDKGYLDLPREVLVTVMATHQRYFPVEGDKGRLLPRFVVVSNALGKNRGAVLRGNERVLRARLEDAAFYYRIDRKVSLEERIEALKKVTFHSQLGTSFEKVERARAEAAELVDFLSDQVPAREREGLGEAVSRAALLSKADLVTEMVGEFPTLHGVMGRQYAKLQGESERVAKAIYEQTLPAHADDRPPAGVTGAIIGLADRMDTVVSFFGIGQAPRATADPYGLRRQALAILKILESKDWRIPIGPWVDRCAARLTSVRLDAEAEPDALREKVVGFFRGRVAARLDGEGLSADVVEAALSARFEDPIEAMERARAMASIKGRPEFAALVIAYKRAANILSKSAGERVGREGGKIDPALLKEGEERALAKALDATEGKVEELLSKRDPLAALDRIAALRGPVDAFFEKVLVMAEDADLRENRLSILRRVTRLVMRIADFSKIVYDTDAARAAR